MCTCTFSWRAWHGKAVEEDIDDEDEISNELPEIKEISKKIGETVSDQGI